ncbi:hypothetical protein RSAG8_13897, partial [Rhizoctonia solani AG-8 WAC10335]
LYLAVIPSLSSWGLVLVESPVATGRIGATIWRFYPENA